MAHVLVMDDDDALRDVMVSVLEKQGHEVMAFGRADEGVDAAKRGTFDLVVTDILMPGTTCSRVHPSWRFPAQARTRMRATSTWPGDWAPTVLCTSPSPPSSSEMPWRSFSTPEPSASRGPTADSGLSAGRPWYRGPRATRLAGHS
jgi:CheY-like chemotaxis protein